MSQRECIECLEPETADNPLTYVTDYIPDVGYITHGPFCRRVNDCVDRFMRGLLPVPTDLTEADGADTAAGAESWLRGERAL